jgi:hypothetical protein
MTKETNLGISLTFSKLAVDLLRKEDPGIRKRGFPRILRQIFKDNTPLEMVFRRYKNQTLGFIPDAFKVDNEQQEITLYEVEDSHSLTIRKLSIIVNLWWVLDDIGWTLHLIVVDRYAVNRKELDLHKWSYHMDRYQLGLAE